MVDVRGSKTSVLKLSIKLRRGGGEGEGGALIKQEIAKPSLKKTDNKYHATIVPKIFHHPKCSMF